MLTLLTLTKSETVWVLDRAYGLAPNETSAAVERMLQTEVLIVEKGQDVFTAGYPSFNR